MLTEKARSVSVFCLPRHVDDVDAIQLSRDLRAPHIPRQGSSVVISGKTLSWHVMASRIALSTISTIRAEKTKMLALHGLDRIYSCSSRMQRFVQQVGKNKENSCSFLMRLVYLICFCRAFLPSNCSSIFHALSWNPERN